MSFETPPPDEHHDPFDEPVPSASGAPSASSPPSSEQPSGEAPKRSNRARERHERRKQQATPRPAGKMPRQLKVPQNINVPNLNTPRTIPILLGVIGAVALVAIIVYVLGRVRNNPVTAQPNALWLGTEWTYDTHTDAQVGDLVTTLRTQQIGTVYAWVSDLQFDGTWRSTGQFDKVKAFVKQFKTAYPEGKIYGWISIPVSDATHPNRLNDVSLQQQVANFSKQIVSDFGFNGVFVDAEEVSDGDQNYLALLRAVRTAVGMDNKISAAIPPDWSPSNADIPLPPQIAPGTEWKKAYKQSVALLVDQMAVLVFNSGLSSASDYSQWVAYQVRTYAQAINELNTNTDLVFGIPTFDTKPPSHDSSIENVDSAVNGIKLGMQQAGSDAASTVTGVAIYGWWTTKDADWAAFQRDWVQK